VYELSSLAGAPATPGPEREWMRGNVVNAVTLGTAPASDVPSVGQTPHLVELKQFRRAISAHCQKHRKPLVVRGHRWVLSRQAARAATGRA
jgi:hypothetical protein